MTTIVIPCFNEEAGLPQLCTRLRPVVDVLGEQGDVEVLFVNDGSTDSTVDVIQTEAAGLPFRIVSHERNMGIGAAFKSGFTASRGDEIVTIDSDCTYDPARIPDILEALRDGADVVTGSPYHPSGQVVGVQGWRLLMSKTLSRMYWAVLPGRLYTYTSCFRAYRRSVLPILRAESNGFLAVTEFLASALLAGARVTELPATLSSRKYGQSKIKVVRVSISHLKYIRSLLWWRVFGTGRNLQGVKKSTSDLSHQTR